MSTSRIDAERIVSETFVVGVEHRAELDSTNDRALQAAAEDEGPLPKLFMADKQTAGRGRGSNRWWTGEGALAVSLLVDGEELSGKSSVPTPMVALAVAVALADTVSSYVGDAQSVGIRWPNDILLEDAKLAGVLIEATADGKLVIGIGLNTNNTMADAPDDLLQPATTLLDSTGRRHNHTDLLSRLLSCLEDSLNQTASRPEEIAARADRLCLQRGKQISIEHGNRTITGLCAGIAPDGALLVDTPEGRQEFHSGVVR